MDEYFPASPINFSLPPATSKKSEDNLPAKDWPHAPVHRLSEHGVYMVTAGTMYKRKFLDTSDKLDLVEPALLSLSTKSGWQLEAWAVLANHYHFVARGSPGSVPMRQFLRELHSTTAREINRLDGVEDRAVWYNYWDNRLTYQHSYLSRLSYVHRNAAKHGLVPVANQYRWCSAAWFERTASPAQVKTIYGFKIDHLKVQDDF
jgi:REP-associated tyrosine transposase